VNSLIGMPPPFLLRVSSCLFSKGPPTIVSHPWSLRSPPLSAVPPSTQPFFSPPHDFYVPPIRDRGPPPVSGPVAAGFFSPENAQYQRPFFFPPLPFFESPLVNVKLRPPPPRSRSFGPSTCLQEAEFFYIFILSSFLPRCHLSPPSVQL